MGQLGNHDQTVAFPWIWAKMKQKMGCGIPLSLIFHHKIDQTQWKKSDKNRQLSHLSSWKKGLKFAIEWSWIQTSTQNAWKRRMINKKIIQNHLQKLNSKPKTFPLQRQKHELKTSHLQYRRLIDHLPPAYHYFHP